MKKELVRQPREARCSQGPFPVAHSVGPWFQGGMRRAYLEQTQRKQRRHELAVTVSVTACLGQVDL